MASIVVLDWDTNRLTTEQQQTNLPLSNGGASVFVESLALSGSRLAKSNREKELIVWLSEHDQSVLGNGMADFALAEMPFSVHGFEGEREFLFAVLHGVHKKLGWGTWGICPDKPFVHRSAQRFRKMLQIFDSSLIDPAARSNWIAAHTDRSWIHKEFYKKYVASRRQGFAKRFANNRVDTAPFSAWAADARRQVDAAEHIFSAFPACGRHGILHTVHGCIICNSHYD